MNRTVRFITALAAACVSFGACAQISLRDDLGRSIVLKTKPERIVTLAPFLTELAFAAGAAGQVVAVASLSDFPPEAGALPQVKTGAQFSLGQIATYKPDLVLAWRDGIRRDDVERMSAFGAAVYAASARSLDDVPRLLKDIGAMTGHDVSGVVAQYEEKLDRLRRENAEKPRVAAFLELWHRPLTTISGNHFMTQALDICHADNVFKDMGGSAPLIEWDELYEKDPFVIVGAGSAANADEFRASWGVRQGLSAVKAERLVFVDSDAFQRPTPRTPDGIAQLCTALDKVRPQQPRPATPAPQQRPSQYGM